MWKASIASVGLGCFVALIFTPNTADACGCFAAPTPATPVIQAGEKILFARTATTVVAHIQIQYEGEAEDFSWLIPVPAKPQVRLGAEEVFAQLEATTNPSFLYQQFPASCGGSGFGCASEDDDAAAAGESISPDPDPEIIVEQSTAGPYEIAVIDADSTAPMLEWLQANRYVIPAGSESLLDSYINDDGYFVAIRLSSGESTGDLQPIVIEYGSDRPMIPLILTRLGAVEDLGVLVWILGDDRAIPMNYRHVVVNDEYVDWINGASNYTEVVARAIDEAEGGRAFVTEYAGSSDVMVGVLDPPGRFGSRTSLAQLDDAADYVRQLQDANFPLAALRPLLERAFPVTSSAAAAGIDPDTYYGDLPVYLDAYDPDAVFDPVALTDDIWERVVRPTLEAGALFRQHDYLTRMYTAISPDEMTDDPVFDFNPDLPQVDNLRAATMVEQCDPEDDEFPWRMRLSDGREYWLRRPSEWSDRVQVGAPRAVVIETLPLEGQAVVEVDNRDEINALAGLPDGGGCTSAGRHRWSGILNVLLIVGSVLALRRRLRRAGSMADAHEAPFAKDRAVETGAVHRR